MSDGAASRTEGGARRPQRTALVLSGGGARGAYQVGVLQGLLELGVLSRSGSTFQVVIGSSAGAINASMLGAYADDFAAGIGRLDEVWRQISPEQVFRTDIRSLGRIGVRWAWDLSFGGALRSVQPKSLLDTAPLAELLQRIPFRRIESNVRSEALYALAVIATDLYTSNGIVFLHGHPDVQPWQRCRWRVEKTKVRIEHVLASSAIPVFFPSVEVDGRHCGDGSIRNTTPLSPAINLGADRIVAVGVRGPGAPTPARGKKLPRPTIAQIAGVLLDAVMLDAIEVDVEHSQRVNTSVLACPDPAARDPFRPVEVLWISPSRDFTPIAAELSDRVPAVLRYLMRGLGSDEAITDLLSYLLFDPVFCGRLIDLGRQDVMLARPDIERFFHRTVDSAERGAARS